MATETRPVCTNGLAEIMLRRPASGLQWDLGWEGAPPQGKMHLYLEPDGDEVTVESVSLNAYHHALVISNGHRVVALEDFQARTQDVEYLAQYLHTACQVKACDSRVPFTWWIDWNYLVVEFHGWTLEMLMSLRDQVQETLAAKGDMA